MLKTADSKGLPILVVFSKGGRFGRHDSGGRRGRQGVGGFRSWRTWGDQGQNGDNRVEMIVLVFSPAELCKRVSAVVPAGVGRFVGPVGLDLPEEQEVPLLTHSMEDLVAPEYKGFVRGRGG